MQHTLNGATYVACTEQWVNYVNLSMWAFDISVSVLLRAVLVVRVCDDENCHCLLDVIGHSI